MQTVDFDRRRQILENRLAQLCQEYEAAFSQQGRMLDDVARLRIQWQIEALDQEIEQVQRRLKQLEVSEGTHNRQYLAWEDSLPEIDFAIAREIVESVLRQFGENGGAALFLLHNSHLMGGKWCLACIKNLLRTRDLKHYPIELSLEARLDEQTLLNRLGQYVGCDPIGVEIEPGQYRQTIRQYAQAAPD